MPAPLARVPLIGRVVTRRLSLSLSLSRSTRRNSSGELQISAASPKSRYAPYNAGDRDCNLS